MCRPADEAPDSYYPARKIFSFAFLFYFLIFPIVLNPTSESSLLFARCFLPMYVTAYVPLLFQKYFWPHLKTKLKRRFLIPFLLFFYVVAFSVATLLDITYPHWIVYFVVVSVLCGDILFFRLGKDFLRVLEEHNTNEYATAEDFQLKYAINVFLSAIILLSVCWIPFAINNMTLIAVSFVIMAAINVFFLIVFLHPHLAPDLSEEDDHTAFNLSSKEKSLALQAEILQVIKDKELFLDPHITLESLHSYLTCGRTYASKACKELGGFYNIINSMRLDYAKAYQKAHPEANQDEVAQESGFTCRQTMAHAKNRLKQS